MNIIKQQLNDLIINPIVNALTHVVQLHYYKTEALLQKQTKLFSECLVVWGEIAGEHATMFSIPITDDRPYIYPDVSFRMEGWLLLSENPNLKITDVIIGTIRTNITTFSVAGIVGRFDNTSYPVCEVGQRIHFELNRN